jgi:hypothetical protein
MSTENQNAGTQNVASQQNNVPSQTSSPKLTGTSAFLSGMKTENDFKKDVESLKKPAGNTTPPNNTTPPQQKPAETPAAKPEDKQTPGEGAAKTGEGEKDIEIETKLFGKQKIGGKKETPGENQVEFKEFSDIEKYVKSNYGVDDAKKFLTEIAPKWREQAQKLGDVSKKVESYDKFFETMPEKLFNAVMAFDQGEDWESQFQKDPGLNFNKKVDDYSKEQLINHYFPGKFSKDDFTDAEEENKALEVAYDAAKLKYDVDKRSFDGKRAEIVGKQKAQMEAYKASINGSVENLRKTLPLISDIAINDSAKTLEGGANAILAEFIDEKGSLRPDAAMKLTMAKHGMEALQQYMNFATKRTETEVREEFVSKAPDKIASGNAADKKQELSENGKRAMNFLKGLKQNKTF